MHLDVLTREQTELLPFLSQFAKRYYLVGGTAVALQLGHRQSIDFDLFTTSTMNVPAPPSRSRHWARALPSPDA